MHLNPYSFFLAWPESSEVLHELQLSTICKDLLSSPRTIGSSKIYERLYIQVLFIQVTTKVNTSNFAGVLEQIALRNYTRLQFSPPPDV